MSDEGSLASSLPSPSSSPSVGFGGFGGEKKLKNESVGTDFLMVRVCLVSVRVFSNEQLFVIAVERTYSCFAASSSQS